MMTTPEALSRAALVRQAELATLDYPAALRGEVLALIEASPPELAVRWLDVLPRVDDAAAGLTLAAEGRTWRRVLETFPAQAPALQAAYERAEDSGEDWAGRAP